MIWGNVGLVCKRIRVEKQLGSGGVRRDPKSRKSKRNLVIYDGAIVFLTEWKIMQSDLFYQGSDVPGNAPVCDNDANGRFTSSASPTMIIYAHAIEQNDREAVGAIGSVLGL